MEQFQELFIHTSIMKWKKKKTTTTKNKNMAWHCFKLLKQFDLFITCSCLVATKWIYYDYLSPFKTICSFRHYWQLFAIFVLSAICYWPLFAVQVLRHLETSLWDISRRMRGKWTIRRQKKWHRHRTQSKDSSRYVMVCGDYSMKWCPLPLFKLRSVPFARCFSWKEHHVSK